MPGGWAHPGKDSLRKACFPDQSHRKTCREPEGKNMMEYAVRENKKIRQKRYQDQIFFENTVDIFGKCIILYLVDQVGRGYADGTYS